MDSKSPKWAASQPREGNSVVEDQFEKPMSVISEAAGAEMARVGAGIWGDNNSFPRSLWRKAVAKQETTLGFWDWVAVERLGREVVRGPVKSPTGSIVVAQETAGSGLLNGLCVYQGGGIQFHPSVNGEVLHDQCVCAEAEACIYLDAEGKRWTLDDLYLAIFLVRPFKTPASALAETKCVATQPREELL